MLDSTNYQDSIAKLAASRRVLILGSSGSGKTTLAMQLSDVLDIEVIHLDACFWQPGWISTPQPQWHEQVAVLVQQNSWIMDGTYESTLHLRIPAADCLIMLDQSRLICLWRVLKRKLTVDDHRRPDAPSGQKLDLAFLRYIWRYPVVTQPLVIDLIRQLGADKTLIRLGGSRDVRRFVRQLQESIGQPTRSRGV
jgi:adenylate kinase family enzyme